MHCEPRRRLNCQRRSWRIAPVRTLPPALRATQWRPTLSVPIMNAVFLLSALARFYMRAESDRPMMLDVHAD